MMKNKYQRLGLSLEQIQEAFPDLESYDDAVSFYLKDEHFLEIEKFLEESDYAIAKDATKGLFLLAGDLKLFPLYEALLDLFADLTEEDFSDINQHYALVKDLHKRFCEEFGCTKQS